MKRFHGPVGAPKKAFAAQRRWLTVGMTSALALSGCSEGTGTNVPGHPAGQICDGTLSKSAADSLRRLAGVDRFTELTGKTDAGEPNKFSLKRAASHLHDGMNKRSRCTVYKADDDSGIPLIQVDFKAAHQYPRPERTDQNQARNTTWYDIGVYANTKGKDSTSLYFRCKSSEGGRPTEYINAGMFSSESKLKGNFVSSDRMNILNSVARHVAAQLKCGKEARLPDEVAEKQDEKGD